MAPKRKCTAMSMEQRAQRARAKAEGSDSKASDLKPPSLKRPEFRDLSEFMVKRGCGAGVVGSFVPSEEAASSGTAVGDGEGAAPSDNTFGEFDNIGKSAASIVHDIEGDVADAAGIDVKVQPPGSTTTIRTVDEDACDIEREALAEMQRLGGPSVLSGSAAPPPSDREAAFQSAVDADSFDIRGKIGQLWSRAKASNTTMKAAYDALQGYDAQRKFRVEWASKEYTNMKETRERVQQKSISEDFDARYQPISIIFKKEGGDQAAIAATRNYVKTCLSLGGRWCKWNVFSKRLEFLYGKQGISEKFTQSWKTSTSGTASGDAASSSPPAAANSAPIDPPDSTTPKPNRKSSRLATGKQPESPKDKEQDPEKPSIDDTLKSVVNKALSDGNKTKTAVQGQLAASAALLMQIGRDPDWEWAKNDHVMQPLKDAKLNLENEIHSSSFLMDWSVLVVAALRKKYSFQQLNKYMACVADVAKLNDKLGQQLAFLRNMQGARKI